MDEQQETTLVIKPPKPDWTGDDPFKDDLFERRYFGDALTTLLRRSSDSLVISIDARWGDGKTTFAKMWTRSLQKKGYCHVYFDAYRCDHMADPFIAFCAEISEEVARRATQENKLAEKRKSLMKTAGVVFTKFVGVGARIAGRAAISSVLPPAVYKEIKEEFGDEIDETAKSLGSAAENAVADFFIQKKVDDEFKKRLQDLAAAVRADTKFPLVVVIDELDRCRPTFALTLIERVKHYFDVPGVAFVFLANMEQLQQYVRAEYGDGVEAQGYLLKFFDLIASLPRRIDDARNDDIAEYSRRLFSHFEVWENTKAYMECIFRILGFTFREMEKCAAMVSLYQAQLAERRYTHTPFVAMLTGLKVRDPEHFGRVARTGGSYDEIEGVFRFSEVAGEYSHATSARVLSDCLKCLYYTNEQLAEENAARGDDERLPGGGKLDRGRHLYPRDSWDAPKVSEIPKVLCRDLSYFARSE